MLSPISTAPRAARALLKCALVFLMLIGAAREASATCFLTSGGGNINFASDGTGPSFYQINVQFVNDGDTGDCFYRIWGSDFVNVPDGEGAFHISDGFFQVARVHPRACRNFGAIRSANIYIVLHGQTGGSQSFKYVAAQNAGQPPTPDEIRQQAEQELQHPPKFTIKTKSCAHGVKG